MFTAVGSKEGTMAKDIYKIAEEAKDQLDTYCTPKKMLRIEAIEFYETVITLCETSVDALKEDEADG